MILKVFGWKRLSRRAMAFIEEIYGQRRSKMTVGDDSSGSVLWTVALVDPVNKTDDDGAAKRKSYAPRHRG